MLLLTVDSRQANFVGLTTAFDGKAFAVKKMQRALPNDLTTKLPAARFCCADHEIKHRE